MLLLGIQAHYMAQVLKKNIATNLDPILCVHEKYIILIGTYL